MKRSLFAATAASALILTAGCSKPDADNQAAENTATAAKTTTAQATPAPPVDREELLQDAVSALQETENALAALDKKDAKAATAALERATGKLEIVLARNPNLALAPVDVSIVSYDVLGSVDAVNALRKSAEEALEDGRLQEARHLIEGLASETVVRVSNLPLATYPDAIKAAAVLVAQNKLDEAKAALEAALSTIVIRGVIHPLPLMRASAAIEEARKLAANTQRGAGDEARIQRLLTTAREQLRLGQALGYATKDEMKDLLKTVDEIEDGTKNKGAATSIFDKIRERFKKATESSQPAEKK
ncbi:hypothetical protein DAH66_21270 [Sphingomonas koreensis]|uniref:YfdX protein n=1 Tax=Sphingomonas koreensis TaxID=93064 RepID=A0A430FXQ3_9SPHN|nr:YfdX family protein [Sphingomonas koreensis]RSY76569.1 hypothetical protein DAH66_21270 [Sphingomonas koreensis]